jgi:outer membrane lipoprotein
MKTARFFLVAGLLLAGCATSPEPIRSAPPDDLQLAAVRGDPDRYRGAVVRWGGQVAAVFNQRDETIVEIVARRLDSHGRPYDEDRSDGRFLVKSQGFLDPAIYASGRELTVHGSVEGMSEKTIGEYRYRYPVVRADTLYLWPPRPPPEPVYRYDPYWPHPWYPWGWPYYYPRTR